MNREISIAPMVDISTIYFRQFMRILSKNTKIYTEMLSASGITKESYNSANLYIHPNEFPVIAQLGGNDPETVKNAAVLVQSRGFSEVNLNCGCPSNKVQGGCFGACLMLDPEHVRRLCSEMIANLHIPVTVKCRLGVDNQDSYEELLNFIGIVSSSGVNEFIIHARKAYLKGLSPADNRKIPPLKYDWVYSLQKDFPSIKFHINGGITSHTMIQENLNRNLGVMIGRLSYEEPWFFRNIDSLYFGDQDNMHSRKDLLEQYSKNCMEIQDCIGRKSNNVLVVKPLLNLFKNQKGSGAFRTELGNLAINKDFSIADITERIIEYMDGICHDTLTGCESS